MKCYSQYPIHVKYMQKVLQDSLLFLWLAAKLRYVLWTRADALRVKLVCLPAGTMFANLTTLFMDGSTNFDNNYAGRFGGKTPHGSSSCFDITRINADSRFIH